MTLSDIQISSEEIDKRLKFGENPLDLSIEAWERKLQFLIFGGNPCDINVGIETCALCHVYYSTLESGGICSGCALYEHGNSCLIPTSTYKEVYPTLRTNDPEYHNSQIDAINLMIDTLKAYKN